MTQKVPHSPFTTRLSGSAKETELRLRNIFQWKKKRPPVVLFLLTVMVLFACFGLVSCQVEPAKQTDDPDATVTPSAGDLQQDTTPPSEVEIPPFSSVGLFNSYVTDFPDYTYTGAHSANILGRMIELEDTPANFAEEMVWNNYWLPFVGNHEPYIALMGSEHMRISAENESELYADGISFSTVTVHTLSVLNTQDYGTTGAYFTDATVADRFLHTLWEDIHEYGLTEYTVAYIDLSWEWTQAALERGPQLGNGRYERLYLLGKTETDSDWKMYNIYWGEYDLNRIIEETEPAANVWQGDPIKFMELTIVPPESWKGKVGYEEGNSEISFYHLDTSVKTGYEGAGNLYNVIFSTGQIYGLNYSFPWPGGVIAVTADGTYWYGTPSDVQYIPSTAKEYTELFAKTDEFQFILSDNLKANSLHKDNPNVPELTSTTREGRTMAVTADTVMTNCYSYSTMYHNDPSTYHWFAMDTENTLVKGDIVLVLEELDGMSRVVIPYGDVPWLYGFVDSALLSDDKPDVFAAVGHVNQAIIAYEVASYSIPDGTGPSSTLPPCRVEILEMQNGWAKVQSLGTGAEVCWVDSSHLYYGFADDPVIDAPTALNFIP